LIISIRNNGNCADRHFVHLLVASERHAGRANCNTAVIAGLDPATSEDMILARHLNVPTVKAPSSGPTGFRDARFGVEVPEGSEIFRTYLGTDYRAKATGGKWLLMSTGDTYASLNELSRAIGANSENAWVNWFYSDAKGERIAINTLRDESKIVQRPSFLRRF